MSGIEGLRFLVGRWRGEGTLRGRPVTSRSVCRESAGSPGALSMKVETLRDGAVIHEEDLLWMDDPGALVRCITRPRTDEEQVWRMRRTDDGTGAAGPAWELTYPGHRWAIRRTAAGYDETFGTLEADGAFRPVVVLSHSRDAPLPGEAGPR